MRVKELIEFLQRCNLDREVVAFDADGKKMELIELEGIKDDGDRIVVRTRRALGS